jgi:cytochrome P450
MFDIDLHDGTRIPAGHRIAVDIRAVHYNPTIYPDPGRCDLFRFMKLKDREGNGLKHNFSTVDGHVSPQYR